MNICHFEYKHLSKKRVPLSRVGVSYINGLSMFGAQCWATLSKCSNSKAGTMCPINKWDWAMKDQQMTDTFDLDCMISTDKCCTRSNA